MMKWKRPLFWLIPVVLIALIIVPRVGTTRTYDVAFDQMIDYLDDRFGATFRGASDRIGNLRGTPYLQADTLYFTDRTAYQRGQLLEFKAWFAQIGDEALYFTIRALPHNRTSITLKYRSLSDIIASPRLERENLETIQHDLMKWLSESTNRNEAPTSCAFALHGLSM